jgi:hypothetical protein
MVFIASASGELGVVPFQFAPASSSFNDVVLLDAVLEIVQRLVITILCPYLKSKSGLVGHRPPLGVVNSLISM